MVIGSFLSSGFKFISYYGVCSNIVIIIKNFRFLRAGHKAGIACERHTREVEKAPLSTQCAGIKSSPPDAHMRGPRVRIPPPPAGSQVRTRVCGNKLGGCESADHPKLPARPRMSLVRR